VEALTPARLKVLLVEDADDDAELLKVALRNTTFDIQRADRLSVALSRLREEPFDLVLLDLSLPDSQGFETFERVRRSPGRQAIIVLTGSDDQDLGLKTVKCGAQDHLIKGKAGPDVLVRSIRYAVERTRAEEETARYAEALKAKNAELERDLNLAREIQQAFLPQRYPVFGEPSLGRRSTLRFCQRYVPAGVVGGDFFDVLRVSKDEAGIIICDVMGHGVRAALVTAMLRALIDERAPFSRHPAQMLSQLNRGLRTIWKDSDSPMFVSAAYLVINSRTGVMQYANAGHPSPFHLRAGRGVESLGVPGDGHGPALGLADAPEFPVGRRDLAQGDRVLLYTDGVYEVEGEDGEFYGQPRLKESAAKGSSLSPELFLDALMVDVCAFSGTSKFCDDACLLSVDFLSEAEALVSEVTAR
jgi:sigma-B regulation protein RsbU (phosphoserine phosphatase)